MSTRSLRGFGQGSSMGAKALTALGAAWQQGAIGCDTLLDNLRAGTLLPPAGTLFGVLRS